MTNKCKFNYKHILYIGYKGMQNKSSKRIFFKVENYFISLTEKESVHYFFNAPQHRMKMKTNLHTSLQESMGLVSLCTSYVRTQDTLSCLEQCWLRKRTLVRKYDPA